MFIHQKTKLFSDSLLGKIEASNKFKVTNYEQSTFDQAQCNEYMMLFANNAIVLNYDTGINKRALTEL